MIVMSDSYGPAIDDYVTEAPTSFTAARTPPNCTAAFESLPSPRPTAPLESHDGRGALVLSLYLLSIEPHWSTISCNILSLALLLYYGLCCHPSPIVACSLTDYVDFISYYSEYRLE